jgi:hypothetical protein|tara:strand:- start:306 stop:728 length:423 start_codon:yes stop_codon:yes gene_type:complete
MNIRQTSIDCYNQIKSEGLLSTMRFKVYEAILNNAPCTSGEAFATMTTKENQISQSRARFTELREMGVIYEVQNRKCTITGMNVIEWDLTDKLPINIKKSIKTKKHRVDDALNSLRELYRNKDTSTAEDWKLVADLIKSI